MVGATVGDVARPWGERWYGAPKRDQGIRSVVQGPFDIFGVELGQRPNFRLWSEVPSDLNGTFELERQCLCNVHFPCLCLLDARQERGFVGVQGRGVHVPDRLLTFVSRKRDLP